jgi:hypothetical protein
MAAENGSLGDEAIAELVAFADGSLAPADGSRVAAKVQASPRLQGLVESQRAAVMAVAMLDAPAPARLQEAVAGLLSAAPPAPAAFPRPRLAFAAGLATAFAAVAAVAVLVLAGGTSAPTIGDTVELAERGPTATAPAVDPRDSASLVTSVAGVSFPNYGGAVPWRRSGVRVDEIDGRPMKTVFYRHDGDIVSYSIVAGEPLDWPAGVNVVDRRGIELRSLEYEGTQVVTWLRGGHTCVLASTDADPGKLLELATWVGESAGPA